MKPAVIPRSLLIFYLLVTYVFLQFCWWFYLLFDLNNEIYRLSEELNLLRGNESTLDRLEERLRKKQLMIFGEGMVFLLLLALGMLQTRRSFRRETLLARQQKNFLLSVTHELKSPLASVKLFLQTLGKRELEREKQQEMAGRALAEVNRLDHLLENILLANRLDSPGYVLQKEPTDLSETVEECVARQRQTLPQPEIRLSAEPGIQVLADHTALVSIIGNLLENAAKYAPDSKYIEVSLFTEGEEAVLRVTDQGPGIPVELKEKIFEKFYRGENEETRRTKGTGLGLYIVRNLLHQHHGNVRIKENSPRGCIFEVRLKHM